MGKQYVGPNVPNPGGQDLPAIFHTLTDGVQPESGRTALQRMTDTGLELQNALRALSGKLGELADIWQAPSTERGANAIRDVQGHVDKLGEHAGVVGTAFGDYIDHVDTARAQVPHPRWFDEMVKSPTPAEALWLGPLLPVLERDLQQRTGEARELMRNLTYAAQAVDAATSGFEPLPSQVVTPPDPPKGPPTPGGGGGGFWPRPTPSGPQPGPTPNTPAPAPQPLGTTDPGTKGPGVDSARFGSPVQLTTESHFGPEVTIAAPASVDSPRVPASGSTVGIGGPALPGGQTGSLLGRRDGGEAGSLGRGGQPGGNPGGGGPGRGGGGNPRGGGLSERERSGGRGGAGRAGGIGGGGAPGSGSGEGDDDYEHQRAAFLYADETADELFGTDEKTAPPVIGGPDH